MLTAQGRIKRLPLSEFQNLSGRGLIALKLKDDDELKFAELAASDEQLIIATSTGRVLRFVIGDQQVPVMGRAAQGQQVLRLGKQESLVSCVVLSSDDALLLVTAQGYVKRMALRSLRVTQRGELGTYAIQLAKTDMLIGAAPALPNSEVTVLTDADRRLQITVDAVGLSGRDGPGERVVKLTRKEKILEICSLQVREDEAE
jgi:DNA gyrase subunit A